MGRKVVAISGWKKSGKDLATNVLVDRFGAKRVSFADPLKDMVAKEYGIDRSWMDSPVYKEAPLLNLPVLTKDDFTRNLVEFMAGEFRNKDGLAPGDTSTAKDGRLFCNSEDPSEFFWTPRALCILKGSANRAVDSGYWTKKAISEIENSESDLVVISDLRYRSESEQLRKTFGSDLVTVRVDRFDSTESRDPSENDLNDYRFDYKLNNRKSKEYYLGQVEWFARTFLKMEEKK